MQTFEAFKKHRTDFLASSPHTLDPLIKDVVAKVNQHLELVTDHSCSGHTPEEAPKSKVGAPFHGNLLIASQSLQDLTVIVSEIPRYFWVELIPNHNRRSGKGGTSPNASPSFDTDDPDLWYLSLRWDWTKREEACNWMNSFFSGQL